MVLTRASEMEAAGVDVRGAGRGVALENGVKRESRSVRARARPVVAGVVLVVEVVVVGAVVVVLVPVLVLVVGDVVAEVVLATREQQKQQQAT